jgi:hypothetical protein
MLPAESACPCQSGLEFSACCAPFEAAPSLSGDAPLPKARASLRHQILSLARAASDFTELWFACLDEFSDPEREALDREPSLKQVFLEHFLWDWFRKYSEARPIARIARAFEATDLRLASRLEAWSLDPWEPWEVLEARGDRWTLRRLGSQDERTIHRAFPHHVARKGDGLLCRILPHLGHDFAGLSVVRFPGRRGAQRLERSWLELCHRHGVGVATKLRPDIHNESWHPLHLGLLRLHPALDGLQVAASPVLSADLDQELSTVLDELGNQSPRQAILHVMGRHRLNRWLDRRAQAGEDVAPLRQALGLA